MDTSNIPKTFWYSLSFCMVVCTVGLLIIAYKASSVSIEIANAKIELSSAVSQSKEIKTDLEAESKRLISAKRLLQENIDALGNSTKSSKSAQPIEDLMSSSVGSYDFEALDAKIRSAEEAIRK